MVKNVQEIQKETQKYASQMALENVEKIYQSYISIAIKKGCGSIIFRNSIFGDFAEDREATKIAEGREVRKLLGEAELSYYEALGYTVLLPEEKYSNGEFCIIAWSQEEKEECKNKYLIDRKKYVINRLITIILAIIAIIWTYNNTYIYMYILWFFSIFLLPLVMMFNETNAKAYFFPKYKYITPSK